MKTFLKIVLVILGILSIIFGLVGLSIKEYALGMFFVALGAGLIYLGRPKKKQQSDQLDLQTSERTIAHYKRDRSAEVTCDAMSDAAAMKVKDYAVVDVETTGLHPETDEIIEVAAIRCIGGELDSYATLVRPRQKIPANITKLTGITNSDVKEAPRIETAMTQLSEFIEGLPIVAHNAPFDIKFIAHAFETAGISMSMQYIDTLSMARSAFPYFENHKLATLIRELELLDGEQQHRAGSDTEATQKLFERCRQELRYQKEKEKREKEQARIEEKAFNLNQYGMQAETAGQTDKAIGYYEDILEEKVALPNAYMRLAIIYKKRQQWEDVVRVCDAALEILPGNPGKLCQPEEYEKRKAYALSKL